MEYQLNLLEKYAGAVNQEIYKSMLVTLSKIANPCYQRVMCAVSGGADSDLVVDLVYKADTQKKIHYVWFDPGLEFEATKEHLDVLEKRYGITIERIRAEKPIPRACKEHGVPFLSKQVSEYIGRLQSHNFQWEDEPIDVLLERYCTWDDKKKTYVGCKIALQWWCNDRGVNSSFNISRNKYLKEFMLLCPPVVNISNKCCHHGKKVLKEQYIRKHKIDLSIIGVRKAEGGVRATAYKGCFSQGASTNKSAPDEYRPIFWYKQPEKKTYDKHFDIQHSRCYTDYGLKRTGCAGCPYNKDFESELACMKKHEPKLYKAANAIFKDAYAYTRKYNTFKALMTELEKNPKKADKINAKIKKLVESHG